MEYPQLCIVGNTLSQEIRFKMETPLFFLNYWKFRRFYMQDNQVAQKSTENQIILNKPMENQNLKEVIIKGNCQISLW